METTLTIENLLAIFQALDRINPIDRSDYFNNYYQEVVSRLQDERKIKGYIESQIDKVQNRQETEEEQMTEEEQKKNDEAMNRFWGVKLAETIRQTDKEEMNRLKDIEVYWKDKGVD